MMKYERFVSACTVSATFLLCSPVSVNYSLTHEDTFFCLNLDLVLRCAAYDSQLNLRK